MTSFHAMNIAVHIVAATVALESAYNNAVLKEIYPY